jgi:hypothetical protein
MSNPVPKQKKSNKNITRHVQEGTRVCFPNPPQTPPIHRSSFALDNLRSQFCSGMFPPYVRSGAISPDKLDLTGHGFLTSPDRRSRLLLYVKIRSCKLFSRLPEIFEGKSRGDYTGEKDAAWPGGKRTPPKDAEIVMEFCII